MSNLNRNRHNNKAQPLKITSSQRRWVFFGTADSTAERELNGKAAPPNRAGAE